MDQTYYQKNRERQLALAKEYQKNNKEKAKRYWASYYATHKTELLAKRKEYARNNKPKIYENYRKKYYKKNYEKTKQQKQEKDLHYHNFFY
jgi:hypothetical protein